MKRQAMIHSLEEIREVEIVEYKDLNHVVAKFNDKLYTAIDNPFSGLIYVDDIYGEIREENK